MQYQELAEQRAKEAEESKDKDKEEMKRRRDAERFVKKVDQALYDLEFEVDINCGNVKITLSDKSIASTSVISAGVES